MPILSDSQLARLADQIKSWGKALGFQQVGISDVHLDEAEQQLHDWLAKGLHGEMDYMPKHGTRRSRPAELEPGTRRVISVRMDYLPDANDMQANLGDAQRSYISRYALGRDYHKLMRNRLQKLADQISHEIGEFGYRAFVDSAPVLEKAIAAKAGLGWVGKHSNLLNSEAGSWFFLGELYTDLALPVMEFHPWAWAFFLVFIVLTSFAILNLFIAIIVDSLQSKHFDAEEERDAEVGEDVVELQAEIAGLRDQSAALTALVQRALGSPAAEGESASSASKASDKSE